MYETSNNIEGKDENVVFGKIMWDVVANILNWEKKNQIRKKTRIKLDHQMPLEQDIRNEEAAALIKFLILHRIMFSKISIATPNIGG